MENCHSVCLCVGVRGVQIMQTMNWGRNCTEELVPPRVRSPSFASTDGANSAVQFLPQNFHEGKLVSSLHPTFV